MINFGEIVFWALCGLLALKILINFWIAYTMAVQKWKSIDGKSGSHSLMLFVEFALLLALLVTATIKFFSGAGPSRLGVVGLMFAATIFSYIHFVAVAMICGILYNRRQRK